MKVKKVNNILIEPTISNRITQNQLINFFGKLDRLFTKNIPDPLIFTIWLTFLVLVGSLIFTKTSFAQCIDYWGKSLWNMSTFTLHMVMVLFSGYLIANSPFASAILKKLCKNITTPKKGIIIGSLLSIILCWLNWGIGLILSAVICREIKKNVPNVHYGSLVASVYTGFLVWHGGLSGSIPLAVATNDSFNLVGEVIPLQRTLLSRINILIVIGLLITLPVVNLLISYIKENCLENNKIELHESNRLEYISTNDRYLLRVISFLAFIYFIFILFPSKDFSLNLESMNFILFFLALVFYPSVTTFFNAVGQAAMKIGPILILFPLYSALSGVIVSSGLGTVVSEWFLNIAKNENSFFLFSFLSAGFVNLFVPSGGGQWIVQGPVIVPAARQIGADLSTSIMTIAWGDAWTNLIQPFWALSVLSVTGLKVKDIAFHCFLIFLFSGIYISLIFFLA